LREGFRFRGVFLMAAPAEVRGVGKLGNVRCRIVGVLCQGAVAGFTGDVSVFARGSDRGLLVVTHHAGILPGKGDRVLANQIEHAWAIVTILSEGLGNNGAPDKEENQKTGQQNQSWPNQMGRIIE